MDDTTLKHVVGFIPTAVVLTYSYLGNPPILIPHQNYKMSTTSMKISSDYDYNPYYTVLTGQEIIRDQIETIHGFVSNILENMQDLDPQFSRLVDEHFWDLA
jgi:hypothetical protein